MDGATNLETKQCSRKKEGPHKGRDAMKRCMDVEREWQRYQIFMRNFALVPASLLPFRTPRPDPERPRADPPTGSLHVSNVL